MTSTRELLQGYWVSAVEDFAAPHGWDDFLTLTYRPSIFSFSDLRATHRIPERVRKDWDDFLTHLAKIYETSEWIAVVERTNQGVPHIHALGYLPDACIRHRDLPGPLFRRMESAVAGCWPWGFIKLRSVRPDLGGATAYVCKYILKSHSAEIIQLPGPLLRLRGSLACRAVGA